MLRVLHDCIGNSIGHNNISQIVDLSKLIFSNQLTLLLEPLSPAHIILRWRRGHFPSLISIVLLNIIEVAHILKMPRNIALMLIDIEEMTIHRVGISIGRNLIFVYSKFISVLATQHKDRNRP
jgi:hypothetical protein